MKISSLGGVGRVLGSVNFRTYWIGNIVSILGFWVHKLALGWLTWQLTESPFWLGAVGFASLFPSFILSPFTGVMADRFGMRRVASYALVVSFCSASLLGLLVSFSYISVETIFFISLVQGIALAFDLPSRQGLVNHLIEREDLSSAIALNTTIFNLGGFLGPGLFALVTSFLELEFAFFINALTFLFFYYCLQRLKITIISDPEEFSDILDDMVEGIRYVINHLGIRSLFLLSIVPHLLIRPFIDLLPGFSSDVFARGSDGIAIMASSFGFGALVIGVILALRGKTEGLTRINVFAILIATICMFGFATTEIFWFANLCLFGVGMSLVAFAVANQSLIQYSVVSAKRGRVISLSTGLAVGLPAFGSLSLGYLGSIFGVQMPVAIAMIVGVFFWIWAAKRAIRFSSLLENSNK